MSSASYTRRRDTLVAYALLAPALLLLGVVLAYPIVWEAPAV